MKKSTRSGITGVGPEPDHTQRTRGTTVAGERESGRVKRSERQPGSDLRGPGHNPYLKQGHQDATTVRCAEDCADHEDQHPAVRAMKGKY